MLCVVAPLKFFAATLLFLSNSSHLFTSLNKESYKITVSGSFFLALFIFVWSMSLIFLSYVFFTWAVLGLATM